MTRAGGGAACHGGGAAGRDVEAAAERRAELLARMEELELRREEAAWLEIYEADEGRYKV